MIRPARLASLAIVGILLAAAPTLAREDDPKKKVDASLVVRTPMAIASVAVLDDDAPARDAVIAWIKPVFEVVETTLADDKRPRTLVVQVTLHPDRAAEVVVAGRPEVSEGERKAILEVADASKLPRSRVADCVLEVLARVNGGAPDETAPLIPALTYPPERRLEAMRKGSTAEKLAIMKAWARSEAIPLIAWFASHADPKFAGVRNVGQAMGKIQGDAPIDVAALTDKNPDYWRAMMEMAPGVPLIPASRVALHAANGEIDAARRVAQIFQPFDRHQSGYSVLLD